MKRIHGAKVSARRWNTALAGLAGIWIVAAAGAARADYDMREYYPVDLHSAWLYMETQTVGGATYTQGDRNVVDRTVDISGTAAVRYVESYRHEFPGAAPDMYQIVGWTDQGLMLYRQVELADPTRGDEGMDETYSPPFQIIPRRMEVGDTSTFSGGRIHLEGVEDVTVPAGTFENCLRLRMRLRDGGEDSDETIWFARGVGLVKAQGTSIMSSVTETYEKGLVAARIGETLYGHTDAVGGRFISFALSMIQAKGCSILLDGIMLAGQPGLYWARFDFDPLTLSFAIADAGAGTKTLEDRTCAGLPGLSLDGEEPMVWDWTSGYFMTAAFFDTMTYAGVPLQGEFSFSEATLGFQMIHLWDGAGTLLYQAP